MTARKRNHAVDVLRAIGIIVMILAHIEIGPWFYKWSHAFHMPLFFLVSGYFFNELAATEHTADYIKKKAQGLLMPYMAVAFVCYVLWSLLKHDRPLIEPLLNIFLLNQSGIPIATAIWFLTCLFMLECTYIGITKLIRYKMGRYFAIALMAGFSIVWSSLVKKELPYSLLPALGGGYRFSRWGICFARSN